MYFIIENHSVTDETPEVEEHFAVGDFFRNLVRANVRPGSIESKIDALKPFGTSGHDRWQFGYRHRVIADGGRFVTGGDCDSRRRINDERWSRSIAENLVVNDSSLW